MTAARIGVVGAGWWSTVTHMPALMADRGAQLVAIVDESAERRRAAVDAFDIPRAYDNLGELLSEGGVDGVIIATPHDTHALLVEQALRHGVSALVEKPMGITAEEVWGLVALERQGTAHIVVGLTYQFSSCATAVRDAVRMQIGELVSVNADFSSFTEELFSGGEQSEQELRDPGIPHRETYSDPATGGGQAYTQLSHLLGGLLWVAGDQALEVAAFMDTRGLLVDVVDALAFRLSGGALCVASSTGTTLSGVPVRHRIRFHGTLGMVEWDMIGGEALLYSGGGKITHFANPADRAPYASKEVSLRFAQILSGQAVNPAPADLAAASISLIEAAHCAVTTGERVAVMQGSLRL